jgi:hypothetical protein
MEIQQQGQPLPRVKSPSRAYVQLAALLLVAMIAFLATWLLVRGNDKSGNVTLPAVGKPAIVTEAQLRVLAAQSKMPVYWAGPKSGAYELTRATDGRVWVRYLQSASQVGTPLAKFLTVGTYPTKTAFVGLKRAAARPGGLSLKLGKGGVLVFNTHTAKSVYFGYPKSAYQVEVYDPSAQQARSLVLGDKIAPIK